jgi:hypothetical protein
MSQVQKALSTTSLRESADDYTIALGPSASTEIRREVSIIGKAINPEFHFPIESPSKDA